MGILCYSKCVLDFKMQKYFNKKRCLQFRYFRYIIIIYNSKFTYINIKGFYYISIARKKSKTSFDANNLWNKKKKTNREKLGRKYLKSAEIFFFFLKDEFETESLEWTLNFFFRLR